MSKTVLITGAHGFLGKHVSRDFAKNGYIVTGIGHGSWAPNDYVQYGLTFWHTSDVTLDALIAYAGEPDVIVHCAGSGSVAFSISHPHQDYLRTVSTTAAVLEYTKVYSPNTAVIYPSSAAVYGLADRLPIKETDTLSPVSPYGVHKRAAEMLCESYAKNFGVSVAIIRFFSIYGAGLQKQLLWDACLKAVNDEVLFAGTGKELRDWLHVQDAASLVRNVVDTASPDCPILNGGSGEGVRVEDILATLLRSFGSDELPSFSGESRPGDPVGYHADMTQTFQLGWRPSIGWRVGTDAYVQWFKENHL